MPKRKPWRSRIVGHGEEAPDQLLANPRNWRIHPQEQQDALGGILDQVGWVQDVIVNRNTGHVVDGHLRVALALSREEPIVPVVYVELTKEEEELILATIDPLAGLAATDASMLAELVEDTNVEDETLAKVLHELAGLQAPPVSKDEGYTQKIVSPIYEPTGDKPDVADLYDQSVTAELLAEIATADLGDDLRALLAAAAARHTVLNFGQIANYYAHAAPDVQRLMEASALVIIDSEQAIERGFLRLQADTLDAFEGDYPGA